MRWLFLILPVALFVFLAATLRHGDAPSEEIASHKVSDALLPAKDPIAFLESCLAGYDREAHGYTLIFHKQELIDNQLQKPEEIRVCFREKPFSVYFEWLKGARQAERCLYVEDENKGMILSRPAGPLVRLVAGNVVERDLDSPDAKAASRYSLQDFGLKKTMERTLISWKKAKARNALHIEYLGIHQLAELDGRECYMLKRTGYAQPEEDGITELTVYIDKETLLQTGTILRGEGGKLIGTYFYRDIRLNPEFKEGQFERSALTPR